MSPREWRTLGIPLPEGVTVELYPFHGPGKPLTWCFVKERRLWPIGYAERKLWRSMRRAVVGGEVFE